METKLIVLSLWQWLFTFNKYYPKQKRCQRMTFLEIHLVKWSKSVFPNRHQRNLVLAMPDPRFVKLGIVLRNKVRFIHNNLSIKKKHPSLALKYYKRYLISIDIVRTLYNIVSCKHKFVIVDSLLRILKPNQSCLKNVFKFYFSYSFACIFALPRLYPIDIWYI